MEEKIYTKDEALEMISKAFYGGMLAGSAEYGDENFLPEDYLIERKK